jgi:citrate/tricarballylate utilization protein
MSMIDELFAEAQRQLNICNSCRYCEGYCAVFPALERRTLLETGDITQIANLCHDCRACFYACMYAPPHEFAVNPPEILSAARLATYSHYVRPRRLPACFRGRRSLVTAAALVGAAMLVLVGLAEGIGALWSHGGPYQVVSYPALLVVSLLPCAWSAAVMLRAIARYWRDIHGPLRDLADAAALRSAVIHAARLSYLRGGGADCYYPGENPSPIRRRLHAAVFYGFAACFAATLSAGFLQDVLGIDPPYPVLSVPVILGTAGGLGMIVGCAGLAVLKRHSDPAPGVADYSLLIGLGLLAITGMLTLLLRATPAYGLILVTHVTTIVVCFGVAPYTRFVHFVYRFLAIVQDNLEMARTE